MTETTANVKKTWKTEELKEIERQMQEQWSQRKTYIEMQIL